MVELGSGSAPHRGKNTVGQYIDRSSKKYSKRGGQAKRYQESIQNAKRSVAKHWGRESGYA